MSVPALLIPILAVVAAFLVAGCGDDEDAAGGPFELLVHPEFVQGLLANEPVTLLVAIEDESGGGDVQLEVSSTDGSVEISPAAISGDEIAEVTLSAEPVTDEQEILVTITARRGDEMREVSRPVIVMPGVDDRGPDARKILDLFLPWLEANHPEYALGPGSDLTGMIVGPRLLVVSHYAFFNDQYELGLSWHIMVQPDDWSDLYIRPRNSLKPTAAFRLSSWGGALEGKDYTISPTTVPLEVVR